MAVKPGTHEFQVQKKGPNWGHVILPSSSCRPLLDFSERENRVHAKALKGSPDPDLPFLAFLEFLALFLSKEFLAFFSVSPFFLRDFRGSLGMKNPWFCVVFLAVFQKSKERTIRGDQLFGQDIPGTSGTQTSGCH